MAKKQQDKNDELPSEVKEKETVPLEEAGEEDIDPKKIASDDDELEADIFDDDADGDDDEETVPGGFDSDEEGI